MPSRKKKKTPNSPAQSVKNNRADAATSDRGNRHSLGARATAIPESDGSTQARRGREAGTRRRNILLAMGFYTHDRHAGIVRYAHEAGWTLDCRLMAFRASEARHLQYLRSGRYDGVLAYLSSTSPNICHMVQSLDVPVVDLGMDHPEMAYPRVLADNAAIGRMGADDLVERGFEQLLFYTHYLDTWATKTRLEGFRAQAEARGVAIEAVIWNQRPRRERKVERLDWLAEQLRRHTLPLAVMAVNDHVAAEVLHACELAELRVPEQVAVLGVDNDELVVDLTAIPISSVDGNRERIGYEAAALLDRLIDGETPPTEPILIPPKRVVPRKSTDILAVKDVNVAIALHYIWEHFRELITVDDVARQTYLSRRHLQDRFREHVGRTLYEEITHQRLNYARRLLEETDEKSHVVAQRSGFGSSERMSKVFARVLRLGPRDYRARHREASI